mmetsp:Transcript_6246/g.17930  ORF Transcript_6246/g.17930 Transcript_6246/m.17930 type:complete len:229 (-) Transcript_6246:362-1048(-)
MDPFNIVKADVQESLSKAQADLLSWQRIKGRGAAANADRGKLSDAVEGECKSIGWQLEELGKAVDAAEKNAARFNLTQADLASRRRWIMETNREVDRMMNALRAPQQAAPPSPTRKLNSAIHEENESFIGEQHSTQQQMMRQQDEDLDQLGESVSRIGHLGLTIHEELQQQGTMLDELDEDVDGTTARLQAAQKRINHVLAKAGMKGQLLIILFLIVVLAVLMMFAFS